MSQVNPHLHELPAIQSPKERSEEEIAQVGLWIANVTASKLYAKKANTRDIQLRLKELSLLIKKYDEDWNQPAPAPAQITRKVTVEEQVAPFGGLTTVNQSWLHQEATKAQG